eukprot:6364489-Prorocentrum_lima.AAC.1
MPEAFATQVWGRCQRHPSWGWATSLSAALARRVVVGRGAMRTCAATLIASPFLHLPMAHLRLFHSRTS